MKGSIVIVGFFVLGVTAGVFGFVPGRFLCGTDVSFYALCALMFFVGMSVGGDSTVLKSLRTVNPRLLLLPLVTIVGTLSAVSIVSVFFPKHGVAGCLVGAELFVSRLTLILSLKGEGTDRAHYCTALLTELIALNALFRRSRSSSCA